MAKLGTVTANSLLNHLFGIQQLPFPTGAYLAFYIGEPENGGVEVGSGKGYARKAIVINTPTGKHTGNNGEILYDEATLDWGYLTIVTNTSRFNFPTIL